MDAVELALVVALLEIEPFGEGEQLLDLVARMGTLRSMSRMTLPRMVRSLRVHRRARLNCLASA